MNYDQTVQRLQTLCAVPLNNTDIDFAAVLPAAFDYADNRIYREMDFLATTVGSSGTAFTIGNRSLTVPSQFINVRYANVVTPAATQPDAGTRHPLRRVSLEYLDAVWPLSTQTSGTPSVPNVYTIIGDTSGFTSTGAFTMRVGPCPDAAYVAEFIGPVRPTVLSATNATTLLTTRYPDLYIAACMIFLLGYQRDFGAQSSDPQSALSWEAQYTSLRQGILMETGRQKAESPEWSTQSSSTTANQPRDRQS